MTATAPALFEPGRAYAERVPWRSVQRLAAIEARRYATRISMWIGWALTMVVGVEAVTSRGDWPGASYELLLPLAFGPLVLGVFIAGVRTGGRDVARDLPALAPEAPADDDDRLAARLVALVVPVGLAALTTAGMAVAARVEGGFWLGEGARLTTTAQPTIVELLQPVLLVALGGAIGVVAGRATRHALAVIVAGVFVSVLLFTTYWLLNGPVLYPFAPPQTMPLRVDIPGLTIMDDTPAAWLVEYPTQYRSHFARALVHQPTVIGHDLYLLGLVAMVAAPVARGRRRLVLAAGAAVAAGGIVIQLAVSPF